MQELTPLLLPPAPAILEPAGLQRFKQYFETIADALKVLQTDALTKHPHKAESSTSLHRDRFDWRGLDAVSAGVLGLVGRLCLHLSPAACSQASPLHSQCPCCDPVCSHEEKKRLRWWAIITRASACKQWQPGAEAMK